LPLPVPFSAQLLAYIPHITSQLYTCGLNGRSKPYESEQGLKPRATYFWSCICVHQHSLLPQFSLWGRLLQSLLLRRPFWQI
jgi:hypothetical protein